MWTPPSMATHSSPKPETFPAPPLSLPRPPGTLLHQVHCLRRAEVLQGDVLAHAAHAVPQEVIPVAVGNLAEHADHLYHQIVHGQPEGGGRANIVGEGHLLGAGKG